MEGLKIWWVYAWGQHYPQAKTRDVVATFKTLEEAQAFVTDFEKGEPDWNKHQYVEIEDVSHLLF